MVSYGKLEEKEVSKCGGVDFFRYGIGSAKMSNIMFFSIPAHGHTNPTLPVVAELVKRGHQVRYYSFEEFKEKIEATGACYVGCDAYLPPTPLDLDKKVGKDFASLIEMVADTTINMDEMIAGQMKEFMPDCIVSDSVCFWGKLFAMKYQVPFVCSTTTMAFNKYTAKLMKQSFMEIVRMFTGMPRINAKIEMLKKSGYEIKDFVSIVQNDNDTNTIVYTSRKLQPMVETFSDKYAFVGPSVRAGAEAEDISVYSKKADGGVYSKKAARQHVYVSLGTVLNRQSGFYRNCMEALRTLDCEVLISVGKETDISLLGRIPDNITVQPYVNQLEVLADTDVFLTHCGMNSANESLYYGVPMVLFPQHSEEGAVAGRIEQLGAGKRLKKTSVAAIRKAVREVLSDESYKAAAQEIQKDFRSCGGAAWAADFIENVLS